MDRDTSPARYMGRVSAKELDLEMMVLWRSKNAASIGRHGRTRLGDPGDGTFWVKSLSTWAYLAFAHRAEG